MVNQVLPESLGAGIEHLYRVRLDRHIGPYESDTVELGEQKPGSEHYKYLGYVFLPAAGYQLYCRWWTSKDEFDCILKTFYPARDLKLLACALSPRQEHSLSDLLLVLLKVLGERHEAK